MGETRDRPPLLPAHVVVNSCFNASSDSNKLLLLTKWKNNLLHMCPNASSCMPQITADIPTTADYGIIMFFCFLFIRAVKTCNRGATVQFLCKHVFASPPCPACFDLMISFSLHGVADSSLVTWKTPMRDVSHFFWRVSKRIDFTIRLYRHTEIALI